MNRRIKAILATLPYREMKELATDIVMETTIGEVEMFADCLSGLAEKEDTEFSKKEQKMLHSMFTRKKQIVIQPYENGFKVSVPAQSIDIYCDDVRDGISQALDNLVALRCMS